MIEQVVYRTGSVHWAKLEQKVNPGLKRRLKEAGQTSILSGKSRIAARYITGRLFRKFKRQSR
ncbi:hypothetical protein ED28_04305 [[Pantoea] beijingensis]|uniref:Uncharacterized protein n=1 Tax=[Pantoea] beijingensis TaxID=1324864 RepID=A0A443IG43_9GAMM|nr:hypothetical protein ED28_04305 [[Pantoea] beijingensis]